MKSNKTHTKPVVVIIEDEDVLRNLLSMTLRSEGFKVFEAGDGKEGLDLVLQHHPDLVLLDIIMPTMNGMAMLKLLRQDRWGKNARVILLTNLGDTESMEKASGFGVADYFIKSDWSLEDLVKHINDKLVQPA